MKKILLQVPSQGLSNNVMFTENDINDMFEPWKKLKSKLAQLGLDLVTADNNSLSDCTFIIFLDSASAEGKEKNSIKKFIKKILGKEKGNDWPIRPLYKEAMEAGMKDKMALILWEPQSVRPENYDRSIWDKFQYIFTWNDDLVDNKKFFKFILPIPSKIKESPFVPFEQKKLLTNISFNKYSSYKNELYKERRKSIEYFDSNFVNDFDLYGLRWNTPITRIQFMFPFLVKKYKTFRGQSKDKHETLSLYKFNLCYENISDARGFVTEKIFDSLKAKIVPIYWGAPNIAEYVDEDSFIDRRKFKNNAELGKYLKK